MFTTMGFNWPRLKGDKGNIDGYDWLIMDSGVMTLAYVRIPENHKLFHREEWRSVSDERVRDLRVNGGCTYWSYLDNDSSDPRQGCWLGWDYGHSRNLNAELTREEVMEDIKSAIDFLEKTNC